MCAGGEGIETFEAKGIRAEDELTSPQKTREQIREKHLHPSLKVMISQLSVSCAVSLSCSAHFGFLASALPSSTLRLSSPRSISPKTSAKPGPSIPCHSFPCVGLPSLTFSSPSCAIPFPYLRALTHRLERRKRHRNLKPILLLLLRRGIGRGEEARAFGRGKAEVYPWAED